MAGNWKMYKTPAETKAFFEGFLPLVAESKHCEIAICPPFVNIAAAVEATRGSRVGVGAQNLYWKNEGAFTGEISGPMIKAAGAEWVIIGHSERRQYFGETDATVLERTKAALAAQIAARRHADTLVSNLAKSEAEKAKQLTEEISQVKETTLQANSKIADVSTDVGAVKQDVVKTQSELQATIGDLRRATGDMGVMSGLIATNAKELTALRELGDRNYVEFEIARNGKAQKVGDILVAVKKTDAKRSKFTVDVIADDKKIEKRDKTANEPVQFYVLSKARQPYELVVNEVGKDSVKGYLAVPEVQLARK